MFPLSGPHTDGSSLREQERSQQTAVRRCDKRRSVAYSGAAPPGTGGHRDIAMCAEASTNASEGADGFEITASLTAVSGSPASRASVGVSSTMCVSSPRVWGTAGRSCWDQTVIRAIPACAGNKTRQSWSKVIPTGHPRVCGEQAATPTTTFSMRGVIPACAGNRTGPAFELVPDTGHPRVCGEQAL